MQSRAGTDGNFPERFSLPAATKTVEVRSIGESRTNSDPVEGAADHDGGTVTLDTFRQGTLPIE